MRNSIKILGLFFFISMLTLFSSCRKEITPSKNEDSLEGKIRVLTDKRYENQLKFTAEKFLKVHPKVQIDFKVEDNLQDKVKDDISNEQIPVDVLTIDDQYVQQLISSSPGAFLDMTEDMNLYKDKIRKGKIDNLTFENKIYGFPWSSYPKAILYRSDIFEKSGINVDDIKTWNDYVYVGRKISKDTGKKLITNIGNESSNIYMVLSNQLGSSYFNKEGKVSFNANEWATVLETVKLLYSEGIIYDLSSTESILDAVKKDEVVSFIADSSYMSMLMESLPDDKGKWKIMKLPAFEPGGNRDVSVGGTNLMINSSSSNSKVAKDFIKFALTDERLQIDMMDKYAKLPVNTDIYNLVEFNKSNDYFNSKLGFLLSNIENGSEGINYTSNFSLIREVVQSSLAIENLKDKDVKIIIESLQKECEIKVVKN